MDVDYLDVTATVYDAVGHTASERFPDLHIRYEAGGIPP
jgi:hypothetical protein